ncbi:MAG: hypothetical protein ACREJG_13200 [Candidatus Rokuibacteriota bacterium]
MADDEGIGAGRIDLERPVVVDEVQLGEAEVEQDFPALPAAQRLEMVGETVLGQERAAGAERGAPHGDGVERAALGEDVVDVVDDVGHDEAVDSRRRAALRARRAAPDPADAPDRKRPARHCAQREEPPSVHESLLWCREPTPFRIGRP